MRLRVAHTSLQFSDTAKQHTSDITKIFVRAVARRYAWITGTEAGPGANNTAEELVHIGHEHDYKMYVPSSQHGSGSSTDCWVAVRKDLINADWYEGFDLVIPGSEQLYEGLDPKPRFPRWGPRGLVRVSFTSDVLGPVSIGAAHYLKGGRDPKNAVEHGVNHWDWNEKLAKHIGEWAKEQGQGHALAFYAGDQNMSDAKNTQPQGDTFFGEHMTSLADELKKWQNTGHGPIDVIASYNRDGRVTGVNFTALSDKEFRLNADHFFLEGVFQVEPPKSTPKHMAGSV